MRGRGIRREGPGVEGKGKRVGLHHGPLEHAGGSLGSEVSADTHGTSALPANGHFFWVTTKPSDVVDGPLQSQLLIPEAVVAVHGLRGEETKGTKTVIDRHRHDVVLSISSAIVKGTVTETLLKGATMDPKVHWITSGVRGRCCGGVDGEIEAILRDAIDRAISWREIATLLATRGHIVSCHIR
jgi:hypothetical protein